MLNHNVNGVCVCVCACVCVCVCLQVLCGDTLVFSELKDLCETWYHLLISQLLYQNPTVRSADLGFHVQVCLLVPHP